MIIIIASFLFVISLVVLVHEWGHFWTARKLKVKVEEFGFGFSGRELFGSRFPPKLFTLKKGGVIYSFNPLPFGGFVKIFGEDGEGAGDSESFISRPVWQRFAIIFAGVFMNVVLAWFLFSLGAGLGSPAIIDDAAAQGATDVGVTITSVSSESPAHVEDFRVGDVIVRLKNIQRGISRDITILDELQNFTKENAGQELTVSIRRGKNILEKNIVPRSNPPEGEGPMGISIALIGIVKTPWYKAPLKGAETVYSVALLIAGGFYVLAREFVSTGSVPAEIAGPVGIAALSGQSAELGLFYFINFIAAISMNLAFLNVLPIPALDGGRLLFLVIEKIKGSRVDQKIEYALHGAFFVILILLIVLITYRDVARLL